MVKCVKEIMNAEETNATEIKGQTLSNEGEARRDGQDNNDRQSQGREVCPVREGRQEGLLVRAWKYFFYQEPVLDEAGSRERQYYQDTITKLETQILRLELERTKLLDRVLLKSSVPPLNGLVEKKPQPRRLPHEQAVEEAANRVKEDQDRRAAFAARLAATMHSNGINMANVDPSVFNELEREL